MFNPFHAELVKWTCLALNLDVSIVSSWGNQDENMKILSCTARAYTMVTLHSYANWTGSKHWTKP